ALSPRVPRLRRAVARAVRAEPQRLKARPRRWGPAAATRQTRLPRRPEPTILPRGGVTRDPRQAPSPASLARPGLEGMHPAGIGAGPGAPFKETRHRYPIRDSQS